MNVEVNANSSLSPAKPSRPSRAYIHVNKQENIGLLSDAVRSATFDDAKGTLQDPCLLGPPSVEFAPYGRIPSSRSRKDGRQSTIDQDPEFIDFLESLTNPITKTPQVDQEHQGPSKPEKVTVTPLVQFLKDKKANKGKRETVPTSKDAKHGRQETKDSKVQPITNSKSAAVDNPVGSAPPKKRSAQAVKVEQAARDAVKVINKPSPGARPSPSSGSPSQATKSTTPNVTPNSTASAALATKQRERGATSAAAKILQRDLGLASGRGGRGARTGTMPRIPAAQTPSNTKSPSEMQGVTKGTEANPALGAVNQPSRATAGNTQKAISPPTGPAATRGNSGSMLKNTHASPKPTDAASTSTQAFLKHANPSQGVTEPLLEEAFTRFGAVQKVEIDKKKGFAYINFAQADSLQKAIAASPIKIAQGQVVVLEMKARQPAFAGRAMKNNSPVPVNRGPPPANARGNVRIRGGMARGGSHVPQGNKPVAKTTVEAAKPSTSVDSKARPSDITAPSKPSAGPASAPAAEG